MLTNPPGQNHKAPKFAPSLNSGSAGKPAHQSSPGVRLQSSTWSDELKCHWNSWRILSPQSIELQLESGNCCDMRGAISLATRLMPDVHSIYVFSGENLDVVYHCHGGLWFALDTRGAA